jgi:hypothetical protein
MGMTIIYTKSFVHYDANGTNRRIITYRVSDSPEFYCRTGLHAWYDEQDAEQCCKDGWTQGMIRDARGAIRYTLVSQAAIDKKEEQRKEAVLRKLFTPKKEKGKC